MKLQLALLLLPLLAIAKPLAEAEAKGEAQPQPEALPLSLPELRSSLRARASGPRTCATTGSNVRYRKCPSTDDKKCPAIGEFGKKGTEVTLECWTVGTKVNGDEFWDRTSKGYYVSEYYVNKDCASEIPVCSKP